MERRLFLEWLISMSSSRIACLAAVLVFQSPLVAAEEAPPYLKKDLQDLTSIMVGQWDNDRQVFFLADSGAVPARVAQRQHLTIESAAKDELEQTASLTLSGETGTSIVITYQIDTGSGFIRQAFSKSPDSKVICEVLWERTGAGFSGRSANASCADLFPAPAGPQTADFNFSLSAKEFWVASSRGPATLEIRYRRARAFSCWAAVLKGAQHGDTGEGLDDWEFLPDVSLHDQGGEATLQTSEALPRTIRLKLRDVEWPYGTRRPSLTLYVYDNDSDRAASYAWTEGGGDRIGINLRWIQASCTHQAPSFTKPPAQ
jgi:hypothetical protein